MPEHVRWSWCNNNRNKVHNKCNALESPQNHPPTCSQRKPVPGIKKIVATALVEGNKAKQCVCPGVHTTGVRGDWRLWFIPSEANSDFWYGEPLEEPRTEISVSQKGWSHASERQARYALDIPKPKTGPQLEHMGSFFPRKASHWQGQKSLCLPCWTPLWRFKAENQCWITGHSNQTPKP